MVKLAVEVSEAEHQHIRVKAQELGISESEYIQRVVKESTLRDLSDEERLDYIMDKNKELYRRLS